VKADLPPDQAAANVAYLKEMLSRSDAPRGAPKRTPVASLSQPD
jgi:Flp pilus assembly protein TadD